MLAIFWPAIVELIKENVKGGNEGWLFLLKANGPSPLSSRLHDTGHLNLVFQTGLAAEQDQCKFILQRIPFTQSWFFDATSFGQMAFAGSICYVNRHDPREPCRSHARPIPFVKLIRKGPRLLRYFTTSACQEE